MTRHCVVHRGDIPPTVRAVMVSAIEQGSGPGIPIYACRSCVDQHGIVPFDHAPGRPGFGLSPLGVRRAP